MLNGSGCDWIGIASDGNSQRKKSGWVMGAGKIWKNVQMVSTAWRHEAGRQAPA